MREKIPALREALEGPFNDLHALLIGAILAHLDFLDEQIDRLSDAIGQRIAPFEPAVELLSAPFQEFNGAAPRSSSRRSGRT